MGSDPVHIPASPFPRRARGRWCKGTPESGAEDGDRTRGLDHGVVVLCPLSYIRCECEARLRPVPVRPRGMLLMNVAALCSVRGAMAAEPRRAEKTKRPGSIRNPGLSCEKWGRRAYTSSCPGCLRGSRSCIHGFEPKPASWDANAIWLATTVVAAQANAFRPAVRIEFVVSCCPVLTMCP